MKRTKVKGANDQMTHAYLTETPYGLLLLTGIVLLLTLIFLPFADRDLKEKTMFSIPVTVFVWIIPSFLISFWLLYLLTKKFLYSKTFTWTHILLTIASTILIALILYIVLNLSPAIFSNQSSEDTQKIIGNATLIVFILFVGAQCTYLVNILLGLLSKHQ